MSVTVSFVTCASREEAGKIARALVEERLAACVNIVPGVTSVYRWEGKIHEDAELLLVVKSMEEAGERLAKRVRELHSYSVPEVVTFRIESGNPGYLDWVRGEVK